MTIVGLLMLFGAAGGLVYFFFVYEPPEVSAVDYDRSYHVLSKEMVNGAVIAKELQRGEKSKEFADWVEPKFYLVCQADFSSSNVVFDVRESVYRDTEVGAVLTVDQVKGWKEADRSNPTLTQVLERMTGLELWGGK